MNLETELVTLDQIKEAWSFLKLSADVVRTPLLKHVQDLFVEIKDKKLQNDSETKCVNALEDSIGLKPLNLTNVDLCLKMENMQTTGSFKIRGVVNQLHKVWQKHGQSCPLVTMSAGNYGKAFAYCVGRTEAKSVCIMPKTAPQNRATVIQNLGVAVKHVPVSDLQPEVDLLVENEGYFYCHSFDDVDLIAGYGSSALELLEDIPNPDVIVVGCGGGGFISGISSAVSLSGVSNCRIYAVEPEGAPTMYESFKAKKAVSVPNVKSVAAGLSPPFAGTICYSHCKRFVRDVILVTDREILQATKQMFNRGIKAEPSGSAALAAVLSGKVPDIDGKRVVVYVTGSNVACEEMSQLLLEVA